MMCKVDTVATIVYVPQAINVHFVAVFCMQFLYTVIVYLLCLKKEYCARKTCINWLFMCRNQSVSSCCNLTTSRKI